jgi:hypothetical protein
MQVARTGAVLTSRVRSKKERLVSMTYKYFHINRLPRSVHRMRRSRRALFVPSSPHLVAQSPRSIRGARDAAHVNREVDIDMPRTRKRTLRRISICSPARHPRLDGA